MRECKSARRKSATRTLAHSRTRALAHSHTRALAHSRTRARAHSRTHARALSRTRALMHSRTRGLARSRTRALVHSSTRALEHSRARAFSHAPVTSNGASACHAHGLLSHGCHPHIRVRKKLFPPRHQLVRVVTLRALVKVDTNKHDIGVSTLTSNPKASSTDCFTRCAATLYWASMSDNPHRYEKRW